MTRPFALRSLLFIGSLWLAGCGDNSPKNSNGSDSSTTVDNSDAATGGIEINGPRREKSLFNDWPRPELAFVLTGQQRGYIEPCGCTEGQSGGIARRADLIGKLRKKGWPLALFDLGETVHRNRRQSQVKFQTLLDAMRDMGYRGLALGPRELRFGADYLLSQHRQEDDPAQTLSFLGANIVFYDLPELPQGPARWKIVTVADRKIGVAAIIGTSISNTIFPAGGSSDIKILDPEQALADVVEELKEQQPDLLVLLSYARLEESRALAEKFPAFDLIVSAGGPEDPDGKPQKVGSSMLVTVGQKGKYVGVVGFFPDDADNRMRFQLVELKKDRYEDDPKMVEHMRYYQDQLKFEKLAATELPIAHPSGAEFVGAKKCGTCHTEAYKVWKKTPHARAFESLKYPRKGDPDYGITRIHDPECLACHVTGWHPQEVLRYETGFVNEEFAVDAADKRRSKLLKGQQCESCHGPGSRHIELIDNGDIEAARMMVKVTLKQAEEKICGQCHDPDNSPHFEFKKYWKRGIEHHGMD